MPTALATNSRTAAIPAPRAYRWPGRGSRGALLTLGVAGAGAKLTAGCAIGWTAIWTFGCGGGGATCALACAFGCGAMLVFCGAGGATVALKSAGVYARRNALRISLSLA